MQTLLRVKRVAEILDLSAASVYRLADQGLLQAVVVAQRERKRILRFRPEAIERFIRSRERRNVAAEVADDSGRQRSS